MGKNWSKGKQFVKRKKCLICKKEFYVPPCYEKRGIMHGKFCSKKCKGINQSLIYNIKYKKIREEKGKKISLKKERLQKKIIKNFFCKNCNKSSFKKFCNRTCYSQFRKNNCGKNIKIINCKNCNKEIYMTNGQYNSGKRYCSISCGINYRIKNKKFSIYGNCKGGKREDLNGTYFRSRWEANYARYLNFLIKAKQILKWEYEIDTFIFESIKKGTRSYIPDFKVYLLDGSIEYHEVKGYLDQRGKTKLSRMKKFYPGIKIILITKKEYRDIYNKIRYLIPNWEVNPNKCF